MRINGIKGFAAFLLFGAGVVFAQDGVNRAELNSVLGADVGFESNSAAPPVVNTLDQIRQIGVNLARSLRDTHGARRWNVRIGDGRYTALEAVERGSDSFSADIIELERGAGVDHIRNLRVIISGFLEEAYGYARQEADDIAAAVTIYNAVNRKKLERFSEQYSKAVMSRLSGGKVGLAQSWREWAGSTQIVIPIYSPPGSEELLVSVETIVKEQEVKAALEKEKIDAEVLVREQKEREAKAEAEAAAAKERAETERLAREEKVRKDADDAARRVQNTERSLAAALERVKIERERLIRYEEEIDGIRSGAEKARREIVRNKFGIPLAGNEAALEMDAKLANQEKLIERQKRALESAERELAELEKQIIEARADAEEKARSASST